MNLRFTPGTQLVQSGRQVVIHFPADADAQRFMQFVDWLQTERRPVDLVVQASIKKPLRAPESVWSLILEAFEGW